MNRTMRVLLLSAATLMICLGAASLLAGERVQAQAGPTLTIQGPTNGATISNPVQMHITSTGATIKPAAAADPNAAHYHYFIDRDPATVVQQGQPIPTGQPDIIHTDDPNLTLPTLTPGQHRVWVVLAHTDHTPFNPNVQAQVTFTVTTGAAATPAASPGARGLTNVGSGGLLSQNKQQSLLISPLLAAALIAGAVGLIFYAALLRSRSER